MPQIVGLTDQCTDRLLTPDHLHVALLVQLQHLFWFVRLNKNDNDLPAQQLHNLNAQHQLE